MPSYSIKALVLRKTKLGETDTILTLLAEDGGMVRAVAKGLRRPGSKFGARLEPYAVVDLLLHTGKSLDVVSEARTAENNSGLREDLDRSAAAAVVADLLDKIALEGQVEPRLFALSTTALAVMGSATIESLPVLVIAFMLKALAMHGYRPALEACVACASELDHPSALSLSQGGMLCPACGDVDPTALSCAPQAREWLSVLMGSTLADIASMQVPDAAVSDCFRLVRSFVNYHVPARLKALDFYAGMLG